jgi:hypothetical protein
MSEEMIALIVTAAVIGLLFAWTPFLNFICPPCSRFLAQRRSEKQIEEQSTKKQTSVAAIRN